MSCGEGTRESLLLYGGSHPNIQPALPWTLTPQYTNFGHESSFVHDSRKPEAIDVRSLSAVALTSLLASAVR